MLHRDLDSLRPDFREKVKRALAQMEGDPTLRMLGAKPIVLETLREVPVQMAYAVKARIKALPSDNKRDADWTREFFALAGIPWSPTDEENKRPSTWTLASKHILGLAVDIAPTKDGVNPWWNAPQSAWDAMAEISRPCGMNPGHDWKNKDSPHHEERE